MSTKTTETAPERVKVQIPRARPDEDPNLFIGVNGVNYILPKGKTSEVPPEVAYEIERSQAALNYMWDESDKRKFKNVG